MITLNGHEIKPTKFPDNTHQVWGLTNFVKYKEMNEIIFKFENDAEIFHLLQLSQVLSANDIEHRIYMPTLPYARQDKPMFLSGSTFALNTFKTVLSLMQCEKSAYDIHNVEAIRSHVINILPYELAIYFEDNKHFYDTIIFPDKGALTRYSEMFTHIPFAFNKADKGYFEKHRDPSTGKILEMKLYIPEKFELGNVLVCDDLIDGGATFINIIKDLKSISKSIDLHISHIIQPNRLKDVKETGYNRIICRGQEVPC
jgi:phosphoribosylpyrophosphate synthetase